MIPQGLNSKRSLYQPITLPHLAWFSLMASLPEASLACSVATKFLRCSLPYTLVYMCSPNKIMCKCNKTNQSSLQCIYKTFYGAAYPTPQSTCVPKQTCASATKLTTLATGPMLQTTATQVNSPQSKHYACLSTEQDFYSDSPKGTNSQARTSLGCPSKATFPHQATRQKFSFFQQ